MYHNHEIKYKNSSFRVLYGKKRRNNYNGINMETKRTRHDYMEDISTPGEGTHNIVWTVRQFKITTRDIGMQ